MREQRGGAHGRCARNKIPAGCAKRVHGFHGFPFRGFLAVRGETVLPRYLKINGSVYFGVRLCSDNGGMRMKQILALAAMLFSGLLVVPQANASAQFGRGDDRVCLYQDVHYEGWAECYRPGDQVPTMRDHNNNVSSIRIFGRATIIVYDNTNFRGQSAEFASDVPDLGLRSFVGSRSWSDKIESFEVGSLNDRRSPGF